MSLTDWKVCALIIALIIALLAVAIVDCDRDAELAAPAEFEPPTPVMVLELAEPATAWRGDNLLTWDEEQKWYRPGGVLVTAYYLDGEYVGMTVGHRFYPPYDSVDATGPRVVVEDPPKQKEAK